MYGLSDMMVIRSDITFLAQLASVMVALGREM